MSSVSPTDEYFTIQWSAGFIILSYIQAVQAAYTAIHILQLRVSRWLYVVGALCLAVSGIWSMHFVGMAAMKLPINVTFDLGWTIGSAFFAFVPCAIGLMLVGEKVSGEPVADIGVKAHIQAMKTAPHPWIVLSAAFIALGVCAMHYTGMHAMQSIAIREMNVGVLIASCFIALFASTAALYFAFVLPLTRAFALPTAFVAGVAVCGMHYTGMYAIHYRKPSGFVPSLTETGTNQLVEIVPYIMAGSWILSFGSQALATFLYKRKLDLATDDINFASEIGRLISRYNMDGAQTCLDESSENINPVLKAQFQSMLSNLEPYRAFLPQSLFLQDHDDDGSSSEGEELPPLDTDDEGSISKRSLEMSSFSDSARPSAVGVTTPTGSFADGGGSSFPKHIPFAEAVPGQISSPSNSRNNSTVLLAGKYEGSMLSMQPSVMSQTSSAASGNSKVSASSGDDMTTRLLTILVVNLQQFHRLLETEGQSKMFIVHQKFVETITKWVSHDKGVVESMQGDRFVISWNAANHVAGIHRRAVNAALAILNDAVAMGLRVSMGLAAGNGVCGNMGTKKFRRFSIVGKVINDAVLLERLCKTDRSVFLLCSSKFALPIAGEFAFQPLDIYRLPTSPQGAVVGGITGKVAIKDDEWMYQLQSAEQTDLKARLLSALEMMVQGKIAEAEAVVAKLENKAIAAHDSIVRDGEAGDHHSRPPDAMFRPRDSVQSAVGKCGSFSFKSTRDPLVQARDILNRCKSTGSASLPMGNYYDTVVVQQ